MPQQPTIRRAEPLDVVNLYRLVLAQGEFDLLDRSDEARALVQVLEAIRDGSTLVAINTAGRIVATIAFIGARLASGDVVCRCAWFAVVPPYRDSSVIAELLDLSLRPADKAGFPVHIPLLPPESALAEAAELAGFVATEHDWIRRVVKRGDKEKQRRKRGQA
jgi:N-acetylglutamate synthase-like GNAT family acetyltransferase